MVAEANPILQDPVPQALEAERRVLGLAMIDPEGAVAMAEALGENDFFRPAHRQVAHVIAELTVNGDAVDPVTVADLLTQRRLAAPVGENAPGGGWLAFTTSLLQAAAGDVFTINASYEAKLVRRTAFQRALIEATGKIAARAYGDGDPEDAHVFALNLFASIGQRFGARPQGTLQRGARPIYEAYER